MKNIAIIFTMLIAATACGQTKQQFQENSKMKNVYQEGEKVPYEMQLSEEEWKNKLTPEEYEVLRRKMVKSDSVHIEVVRALAEVQVISTV